MNIEGLNEGQREAVISSNKPLFIQAGAGTGKTHTLSKKIAYGLSADSGNVIRSIDNVLTITFTKKAAAELISRIRSELRSENLPDEALRVDGAWISTIHGMCNRILMSHALEAGVDPGSTLLSDEETREIKAVAFEEMLSSQAGGTGMRELEHAYGVSAAHEVIEKLASLISVSPFGAEGFDLGPLRKIDHNAFLKRRSEALTAFEEGLRELGIDAENGTKAQQKMWPAFCEAVAETNALLYREGGCTFDEVLQLFDNCSALSCGNGTAEYRALAKALNGTLADLRAELRAHVDRVLLETALELADELCRRHSLLKTHAGLLDTDDLLVRCFHLLDEHDDIAAIYKSSFDSVMVDEFQDTDQLQVSIIENLVDEQLSTLTTVGDEQQSIYSFRGAELEVFKNVRAEMAEHGGVEAKLRYNYRSHPDVLNAVERIFARPNAFGDAFFEVAPDPNFNRELPWIGSDEPHVEVICAAGHTDPKNGRRSTSAAELRIKRAESVAERLKQLNEKGASYGDMAILMRTTKSAGPYLSKMRSLGIPCIVSGGNTFFSLPEVIYLVDLMRVLDNRDDDPALYELLASPVFAISDDDVLAVSTLRTRDMSCAETDARGRTSFFDALVHQSSLLPNPQSEPLCIAAETLEQAQSMLGEWPVSYVVKYVVEASGWKDTLVAHGVEGMATMANIQYFCDLLDNLAKTFGRDLASLVDRLRLQLEAGKGALGSMVSEKLDAVRIMTIHASKGLEFPITVVDHEVSRLQLQQPFALSEDGTSYLVSRLSSSCIPEDPEDYGSLATATGEASFMRRGIALEKRRSEAEEQRLLYVALTRAKDLLIFAGGDSRYGTDPTKLKDTNPFGLVMWGLFGEDLPSENSVCKVSENLKVGFTYIDVPYGGPVTSEGDTADATECTVADDEDESSTPMHRLAARVDIPRFEHNAPFHKRIHSYSSLSSAAKDAAFAEPDISIAPRYARKGGTVSGVGSAFHAVAQWLAEQGAPTAPGEHALSDQLEAQTRFYKLESEDGERLSAAVEAWMSSELYASLGSYERLAAEYPFRITLDDFELSGFIDLLCVESGGKRIRIIDYKTGFSTEDDMRARYELQAQCYAYAVLSTMEAEEVVLDFVHPERDLAQVTFTYAAKECAKLRKALMAASASA